MPRIPIQAERPRRQGFPERALATIDRGLDRSGINNQLDRFGNFLLDKIDIPTAVEGFRRTGRFIKEEGFPGFITAELPEEDQKGSRELMGRIRENPLRYVGFVDPISGAAGGAASKLGQHIRTPIQLGADKIPLPQGDVVRELGRYGGESLRTAASALQNNPGLLQKASPQVRQVFETILRMVR